MSPLLLLLPIAFILLGLLALELWGRRIGDHRVELRLDQISERTLYFASDSHACIRFNVPFKNTGKQQGLIIDAHAVLQPAGDLYSHLQPVCRWKNPEAPRADGYWEACIVKAGKDMQTEIELWLTAPDIKAELAELEVLRIDFNYKAYCRNPMGYYRQEVAVDFNTFKEVQVPPPQVEFKPKKARNADANALVKPLRTQLLRPGDNLVELVAKHTEKLGRPGDIVALAESAVAICQGRVIYCEHIKPGFFATRLNKLFDGNSSMSSVYAMQMAIKEAGLPKILFCTLAGVLGKLRGKPGEFYRLAGRAVAVIDDCTGTLPPFDKHVVMGPAHGDKLVAEIQQKTGLEAAIVDANDLGKVDVLHLSDKSRHQEVVDALKPNPQGNAGEMTPLVLIQKPDA